MATLVATWQEALRLEISQLYVLKYHRLQICTSRHHNIVQCRTLTDTTPLVRVRWLGMRVSNSMSGTEPASTTWIR